MKIIFLLFCSLYSMTLLAQKRYQRDTVPVNNAIQDFREQRNLLKNHRSLSITDPNKDAVAIVNDNRLVAVDTILYIKPENVKSVKIINGSDSALKIRSVLLITTK